MNMKTTALAVILAVSAVAMIGAGYAAYTGVTTSTDNAIGETHLYVTNGIESAVLVTTDDIIYDSQAQVSNPRGTTTYTFTVDIPTSTTVSGDPLDVQKTPATATAPQKFNTQTLTFTGTPAQTTKVYVKVELPAEPTQSTAPFKGTYSGTTVEPDIKICAQATAHGSDPASSDAWKSLNTVATYGQYQLLISTESTTADLANVLDIHFGAYGETTNTSGVVPAAENLTVTFLVITDLTS